MLASYSKPDLKVVVSYWYDSLMTLGSYALTKVGRALALETFVEQSPFGDTWKGG